MRAVRKGRFGLTAFLPAFQAKKSNQLPDLKPATVFYGIWGMDQVAPFGYLGLAFSSFAGSHWDWTAARKAFFSPIGS